MLLACHSLEGGDLLGGDPDLVIGWELLRAHIKLFCTIGLLEPNKEMLDEALVDLMENVRGNGLEDIHIR